MSLLYPISSASGGALIGLAAATLLLGNGDIMGASGILNSVLSQKIVTDPSQHWKLVFVASYITSARVYMTSIDPDVLKHLTSIGSAPMVSPLGYVVGGLLVGFGTTLGNGCTSGHGICGMARFSPRSLMAVATFMSMGVLTASMCSPDCPLHQYLRVEDGAAASGTTNPRNNVLGIAITTVTAAAALLLPKKSEFVKSKDKFTYAAVSAAIFAAGIGLSGMVSSVKIMSFLDVTGIQRGTWDPSLLIVMGGGFLLSFIGYQFVPGFSMIGESPAQLSCPVGRSSLTFNVPTSRVLDVSLFLGALSFGVGWGICGVCPAPGLFLAAAGVPNIVFRFWPAYLGGSLVARKVKTILSRNEEQKKL